MIQLKNSSSAVLTFADIPVKFTVRSVYAPSWLRIPGMRASRPSSYASPNVALRKTETLFGTDA
ncbi:MAG: hypothetical protein ACLSTV_00780 [Coriobacteriales bacterium]